MAISMELILRRQDLGDEDVSDQGYAVESLDERQCRHLLVLHALGLPVYVEGNPRVETRRVRLERLATGRTNSALHVNNEPSYLWPKLVDSARCLYISANMCLDNQNGILMARSDIRARSGPSALHAPQGTPRDNETRDHCIVVLFVCVVG